MYGISSEETSQQIGKMRLCVSGGIQRGSVGGFAAYFCFCKMYWIYLVIYLIFLRLVSSGGRKFPKHFIWLGKLTVFILLMCMGWCHTTNCEILMETLIPLTARTKYFFRETRHLCSLLDFFSSDWLTEFFRMRVISQAMTTK